MQFVVEGENTQIGQFTLNFESNVDQSLHTRCFKNLHWIKQLLKNNVNEISWDTLCIICGT